MNLLVTKRKCWIATSILVFMSLLHLILTNIRYAALQKVYTKIISVDTIAASFTDASLTDASLTDPSLTDASLTDASLTNDQLIKRLTGVVDVFKAEATGDPAPTTRLYTLNNPTICNSSDLKYLAYVHTHPANEARRDLLRETWANTSLFGSGVFQRVFFMGRSDEPGVQQRLEEESERHHDIVQSDFLDSYRNLTLKAVLALQWITEYCSHVRYAIKTDDDAFVNIFSLVELLSNENNGRNLRLYCMHYKTRSMPILRDPKSCSKWCVHPSQFRGERFYPQYCAGLGFVISGDLVPLMFDAALRTPFFWVDDVYITGLLPKKIPNVKYIDLTRSYSFNMPAAINDAKNMSSPFRSLFLHTHNPHSCKMLWNLMLERR